MPAAYLKWEKIYRLCEGVSFTKEVMGRFKDFDAGKLAQKTLCSELTRDIRNLRQAVKGDEKPYVAPVLMARCYKALWGKK